MKTTRILLGYCIVIASWVLMGCNVTDSSPDPPIVPQASESVTDVEGNVYRTAKISNQTWMTENLNVGRFKNGDPIPEAKNKEEWLQAGSACKPAWCYYNNDSATGKRYGKLYNWYAVADPRGLAPAGWSVPNNNEWGALISALGGSQQAGTKMKSTTGWNGNNASGFDGLPGGGRAYTGAFGDIGAAGIWWSSLEMTTLNAWGYNLNHTDGNILQGSFYKTTGLSVRALKSTSSPDDSTSGKTLGEQLQAVLDASLKSSRGRGVSLAVIMPDGELWAGVGGISHGTTPITRDMRFSAGSIEKMFAAATILQLAEEGRLTLDDSLYQWLPAYPYVDSTITIRQLLNHTSGLYNFVDNREFWDALFREPTKIWTPEEIILTFNHEPVYPKGTGWEYSQTGYNLIRMIIKKITGLEIATENDNRFLKPLGLANTFTSMGEALPPNLAHGWYDMNNDLEYEDLSTWPRTPLASGIGGEIWTTAEDLAKWARALFHDKRVINQASLNKMLTFHSPCTGEEFFTAGYGLGVGKFNPQLTNGLTAYGHGGHGPGFGAACIYLPDYGVCIGIMDNTDGGECIGTCLTNVIKVVSNHRSKKQ